MNTKKFQIEKKGKLSWVVIRQEPHDPQYRISSHIPGYGKVVAIWEEKPDTDLSWLPNGGKGVFERLERIRQSQKETK